MQKPNSHENIGNPYAAPQSDLQSLPLEKRPLRFTKQVNWNLTVLAWLVFLGGFAVICAIEYTMRHVLGMEGLKSSDDMAGLFWFSMPCLLAAYSLYLLWLSTAGLQQTWKRCLVVGFQGAIGFVAYAYFGLVYVVYSGIDSL